MRATTVVVIDFSRSKSSFDNWSFTRLTLDTVFRMGGGEERVDGREEPRPSSCSTGQPGAYGGLCCKGRGGSRPHPHLEGVENCRRGGVVAAAAAADFPPPAFCRRGRRRRRRHAFTNAVDARIDARNFFLSRSPY